jgi:ABC-type transport system substrate-binding protein
VLAGVFLLAACTNTPPPPLVAASEVSTPQKPPKATEVVVGVDSVAGGYNPHKIADQSTITTALSTLLLPAVFRPAADGTPALDRSVMLSAQVTNAAPFTVSYAIRTDATWSDNAPIAAEDFVYLAQQLSTQPGVIDPAGYRLISEITARAGGKVVEVRFARPYPAWRSLFTGLLPSHVFKDAPGGWTGALAEGFPVYGGPFAIKGLDRDRGEVVLERNDRYWGTPTRLDTLVLRRADRNGLINALRNGDNQLAVFRADPADLTRLRELGPLVQLSVLPRATVIDLVLRPTGPATTDPRIRGAVTAALDRAALIGTNEPHADDLLRPPSRPGYQPTIPPGPPTHPDAAAVTRLLTEAGYLRPATGPWAKDGKPLHLTIGAPADREPLVALANQVRQQLAAAGIEATVSTTPAAQLYAATGQQAAAVDILVIPQPVGGDPATALASRYGCPSPLPNGAAVTPDIGTGFCDKTLQPQIDAALTGAVPAADALAALTPALWAAALDVPLYQLVDELALRPEVSGITPGPPFVEPFATAPGWLRRIH